MIRKKYLKEIFVCNETKILIPSSCYNRKESYKLIQKLKYF